MKTSALFAALGFVVGGLVVGLVWTDPLGWREAGGETSATATGDAGGPGSAPAAEDGERRILYWRAPMDPTYIRDEPGQSPMGMALVPVYEDEGAAGPGVVSIDPRFVQNFGVRSVPVVRADIARTIRTVGSVAYDDEQIALVTTKYEGWIERAYVNYVGQEVSAGDPLFEVYSPALVSTQEEYLHAVEYATRMEDSGMADMALRAASMLEAARRRLTYWDVSPAQIAELEASGEPLRTLPVVAGRSGLVVWKMDAALEGMYVNAGMNLYRIADLSSVWVDAQVFEGQLPGLAVGQSATITVPFDDGPALTGRIRHLAPYLTEETRALTVSIELPNPDLRLRPGMFVDVMFERPAARDALTVPSDAVIRSGTRDVVVLDLGSGTFQVREVELGVEDGDVVEITSGLDEGDDVVVSAQFLIDSESNLREAIRKLGSEPTGDEMPKMEMPDTNTDMADHAH